MESCAMPPSIRGGSIGSSEGNSPFPILHCGAITAEFPQIEASFLISRGWKLEEMVEIYLPQYNTVGLLRSTPPLSSCEIPFSHGPGLRPAGVPLLRPPRQHGRDEVPHARLRQRVPRRRLVALGHRDHQVSGQTSDLKFPPLAKSKQMIYQNQVACILVLFISRLAVGRFCV